MKSFDIFITHVSWGSGGKPRPVLVLLISNDIISVYPITTRYANKSETIKARYFKIIDWSQAGLDNQSYIDTGILLNLPISVIDNKMAIGQLSVEDKKRLLAFLTSTIP